MTLPAAFAASGEDEDEAEGAGVGVGVGVRVTAAVGAATGIAVGSSVGILPAGTVSSGVGVGCIAFTVNDAVGVFTVQPAEITVMRISISIGSAVIRETDFIPLGMNER